MGFGAHLHRLYPDILYLNMYLIPLLVHAFASRFSEDIDEVDNTPLGARLAEPSTVRSKLRRPSTVDDLAGVPLLISAPCSHCEQISTRGSDAAVAPTWPQCGQVIRVSMSVATAADGAAASIGR